MSKSISSILLGCGLLLFSLSISQVGYSQSRVEKKDYKETFDTLRWSMGVVGRLLYSGGEWYVTDSAYQKPIKGILDHAENAPIDTIAIDMNRLLDDNSVVFIFDRNPQDIKDFEPVSGYIMPDELDKMVKERASVVTDSLQKIHIPVPDELFDDIELKAGLMPVFDFYPHLKMYNDSLEAVFRDSVSQKFRESYIDSIVGVDAKRYEAAVEWQNFELLCSYNDQAVENINDSVRFALDYLTRYAEADSVLLRVSNISGDTSEVWTANMDKKPVRFYLKNEQNDSLGVVLRNTGKGDVQIIIDDGVRLARFSKTQFKGARLKERTVDRSLKEIKLETPKAYPWDMGGEVSVGISQVAMANWARGGEPSGSCLLVGKYKVYHLSDNVKWENDFEVRYGGYLSGGFFNKSDDKMEVQSRFGYSAFKKWYYSAESNFRTQWGLGYKNVEDEVPISAFMSPGYLTFSIGLDYNPNKDFSLFISPITTKVTYVSNSNIDPTRYGLEPGTTLLRQPGMIMKCNYKRQFRENIRYETKAEIFRGYVKSDKNLNVIWDQLLVIQATQYIDVRLAVNIIFDENVKFPILDSEGNETGDTTTKWQLMEVMNIGFNYKF